nr:GNAT family N-acetyltransferase [uncultured Rhodoferax sp.]
MLVTIRDFQPLDAPAVNALAVAAFEQYTAHYSDWPAFSKNLANTSALADQGELIVAEAEGLVVGTVAYISASRPKSSFFDQHWPIMRMLVVSPSARGLGIGRLLAQECINRATRDKAEVFALHTTPIMQVALSMYERMGFTFLRPAPAILGVSYGIYTKRLVA